MVVTERFCDELEKHEFIAVAEIFPPVAPTVAVIELLVDEPVHPEGNVHI